VLDVTVVGTANRRQLLVRRGARPGDELYVSGTIGAAAAGLEALKRNSVSSVSEHCIQRFLYPEPRVRLGLLLARNRAASACIDLSDGLADGVRQLAQSSGVGAVIDAERLPIDRGALATPPSNEADTVIEAIARGDDYELLFSVSPRLRSRLRAAERHSGVPMTRIGMCTGDAQIILRRSGREEPLPQGYSHFR
jgi:thiamine-monophosphate kinase